MLACIIAVIFSCVVLMEEELQQSTGSQNDGTGNVRARRTGANDILANRYVLYALVLAVLVLAVYLRLGMFHYQGFFEPDGFFHYSVIREAVANGLAVPRTLSLSGIPWHNEVTEPLGLYFMTLVPYALLLHSVSYYTIMRLVPVFFGMLDVLGAFFIMKHFAKSNALALLGAFFVAISSGDIARTAALVYRGDGFITIFMIVALLLMFREINAESVKRKALWALGAAFTLGVGTAVWGGAPFTVIVYLLGVLLLMAYGFVMANRRLLLDSIVLSLALLVTYALQHAWMALSLIRGSEALSSAHFFLFWLPMAGGAVVLRYIVDRRERLSSIAMNPARRAGFLAAIALVSIIVIVALYGSYLAGIASGGGLVIASGALGKTIQELQKPTLAFIWGSFGFGIILAPAGVLAYLFWAHRLGNYAYHTVGKLKLSVTPVFLLMLGYLVATAYLQYNAVRFNSLVAVPIAVFAAYGTWAVYRRLALAGKKFAAAKYIYLGLIVSVLIYGTLLTYRASYSSSQADGINPQFLSAMSWLKNNTASNATVLAVWPDGSVVEGWADRTSVMDSVGGQNSTRIAGFSNFILNTSPDTQYLYAMDKPQYLVARGYWYAELAGIAQEGSITNASAFGYDVLDQLHIANTSSGRQYAFASSTFPYYKALMLVNSTGGISAGIGQGNTSSTLSRVEHVMLYNENNYTYQIFNSTAQALNYTLLVSYGSYGITGAAILGPKLLYSNAFRFTYTCSQSSCSYGNGTNVSMQLVYRNADTSIFKINYTR